MKILKLMIKHQNLVVVLLQNNQKQLQNPQQLHQNLRNLLVLKQEAQVQLLVKQQQLQPQDNVKHHLLLKRKKIKYLEKLVK